MCTKGFFLVRHIKEFANVCTQSLSKRNLMYQNYLKVIYSKAHFGLSMCASVTYPSAMALP